MGFAEQILRNRALGNVLQNPRLQPNIVEHLTVAIPRYIFLGTGRTEFPQRSRQVGFGKNIQILQAFNISQCTRYFQNDFSDLHLEEPSEKIPRIEPQSVRSSCGFRNCQTWQDRFEFATIAASSAPRAICMNYSANKFKISWVTAFVPMSPPNSIGRNALRSNPFATAISIWLAASP